MVSRDNEHRKHSKGSVLELGFLAVKRPPGACVQVKLVRG